MRLAKKRIFIERIIVLDQIKAHVKKHEKKYLVGTAVVVTYVITRHFSVTVSPVFNNMPIFNNDNSSLVNLGGHTTKIVKRLSDDYIWETVTDAARENNASLSLMSRHLNGHKSDVYGEQFKIIGIGTTN